ncbi:MAG TPA: hypothetical protein VNQ76_14075 [Planctomicrobium sp.]|nr:hypothetical protein [Planctomicrobium sp.]
MHFSPAILRGLNVIEFPRPVISCRLHDSWDYLKLKVPRQDGDQVAGTSRDGVDISLEGEFGSVSGSLKLSEEAMLNAMEELRTALHVENEEGYSLALFKSSSGDRRYFQNCLTTRFEVDFSNPSLFSYTVVIHASNPVLYRI